MDLAVRQPLPLTHQTPLPRTIAGEQRSSFGKAIAGQHRPPKRFKLLHGFLRESGAAGDEIV
jgi:hypothetical protein